MSAVGTIVYLAVVVLLIAGLWKVLTKAGQPGWGAIIPIYNYYLLCKVAGRPGWWTVLFFVPLVNFVIFILVMAGISRNFGRSGGFTVGLVLLPFVFVPMLGFGDSRYLGAAPAKGAVAYGY